MIKPTEDKQPQKSMMDFAKDRLEAKEAEKRSRQTKAEQLEQTRREIEAADAALKILQETRLALEKEVYEENLAEVQELINQYGINLSDLTQSPTHVAIAKPRNEKKNTKERWTENSGDKPKQFIKNGKGFGIRGNISSAIQQEIDEELAKNPEYAAANEARKNDIKKDVRLTVSNRYKNPDYPGNQTA
jgi:ribosomal protein S25